MDPVKLLSALNNINQAVRNVIEAARRQGEALKIHQQEIERLQKRVTDLENSKP